MMHYWSTLCLNWSHIVFQSHYTKLRPKVRAMRLLEEAIELAQAEGVKLEEVEIITQQVYSKSPGEPISELGGVLTTAAAYAGIKNWNLEEVFLREFNRMMTPEVMERVRARNLSGDKIGIDP